MQQKKQKTLKLIHERAGSAPHCEGCANVRKVRKSPAVKAVGRAPMKKGGGGERDQSELADGWWIEVQARKEQANEARV